MQSISSRKSLQSDSVSDTYCSGFIQSLSFSIELLFYFVDRAYHKKHSVSIPKISTNLYRKLLATHYKSLIGVKKLENKDRHGAIDFARTLARHSAMGWVLACYETGAKIRSLKDLAVFIGSFLVGVTISAGAYEIGKAMAGDPQNDSIKSNLISVGIQIFILLMATAYIV